MLTALVSAIIGHIGGVIPDVVKEVRDTRAHTREREFLTLQHGFQIEREKLGAESKLREAEASLMAEEMRATREHLAAIIETQANPTGILWIDGFNAVLRPATAALMIALFVWTAAIFVGGVMDQYGAGKVEAAAAATLIWNSLIGEAIQAVLGYLFGYRSARKRAVA